MFRLNATIVLQEIKINKEQLVRFLVLHAIITLIVSFPLMIIPCDQNFI